MACMDHDYSVNWYHFAILNYSQLYLPWNIKRLVLRSTASIRRLYYPYRQYTNLFIFRFVSEHCLRSTLRLFYLPWTVSILGSLSLSKNNNLVLFIVFNIIYSTMHVPRVYEIICFQQQFFYTSRFNKNENCCFKVVSQIAAPVFHPIVHLLFSCFASCGGEWISTSDNSEICHKSLI